jgi:molybdopterin synthase sulfur carrier subunit
VAELTVRYFAGASAATGLSEEQLHVPAGTDVARLRELLSGRHPRLVPVLGVATLLVDAVAVSEPHAVLDGASSVDVLPPFAGG